MQSFCDTKLVENKNSFVKVTFIWSFVVKKKNKNSLKIPFVEHKERKRKFAIKPIVINRK